MSTNDPRAKLFVPCPDGDSCPDARKYGAIHPDPTADPDAQTPLTDEREMKKSIKFTLLCDNCGKPISLHDRLAMCPKNSADFGQIEPPKATGRELFYAWDGNNKMHCVVNADFARSLERENADLRRQLEAEITRHRETGWFLIGAQRKVSELKNFVRHKHCCIMLDPEEPETSCTCGLNAALRWELVEAEGYPGIAHDFEQMKLRAETAEADARELWEFLVHLDFSKIHATIEKHRAKYGREG